MDYLKKISRLTVFSKISGDSRHVFLALLLVLLTSIAYRGALECNFINYDDNVYVTQNPVVRGGLSGDGIIWAFTTTHACNWHPITWLSHMLDCQLYGLAPKGHHLTNLLLHLMNTLLLFFLLKKMTGALWRSFLVAALFAVHPQHVESVAWIAERKDVLSAYFGLLTIGAYLTYVEQPTFKHYLAVFAGLTLGLMAKPMVVTLPFALLLLDYWPLGRLDFGQKTPELKPGFSCRSNSTHSTLGIRKIVGEKLPLFLAAAASSFITYYAQHASGAVVSLNTIPLEARISNAIVAYVEYMSKTIWPQGFAIPYPPVDYTSWQIAGAFALIVLITALVLIFRRHSPYLIVGWFWFLGTLVPVIGLVAVGAQAMADRYTYLPTLGLFIALAWSLPDFRKQPTYRKYLYVSVAILLIVILTEGTRRQTSYWHDSSTLFQHTLAVTGSNYTAHIHLAGALREEGRPQQAVSQLEAAIRLNPESQEAYIDLGVLYVEEGKTQSAIDCFRKTLQINPLSKDAHFNLGFVYRKEGKLKEAFEEFTEALRIAPNSIQALESLGNISMQQGRPADAARYFFAALRLDPNNAQLRRILGVLLGKEGKQSVYR